MKLRLGPRRKYFKWHEHFCWLPVIVNEETIYWLTTITRRARRFNTRPGWYWEYAESI